MFKGVENINDYTNSEIIDINLKFWLDESFLAIGAYNHVSGDFNPVENHFYQKGKVWESQYQNIIWEYPATTYVNGIESGNLNYYNGNLFLDNAVSIKSKVSYDFYTRRYNVYRSEEVDWFNEIESYDINQPYGSGTQRKLKLPCVIIESTSKSFSPYQLGGGMYSHNVVVLRVIANTRSESKRVADILSEQTEKTIFLFDPQLLKESGVFPLNSYGYLNSGAMTYSQLIVPKEEGGYRWRKMNLGRANKQECDKLKNDLYHTAVRFNVDLVLTDI